jgi:hypothetical protein
VEVCPLPNCRSSTACQVISPLRRVIAVSPSASWRALEFRGGLLHRGSFVRRLDLAQPDGFAGDLVSSRGLSRWCVRPPSRSRARRREPVAHFPSIMPLVG